MHRVAYDHRFEYTDGERGGRFPKLVFTIRSTTKPNSSVDLDAYLDSGAERSLFAGWIGEDLGLDILSGPELTFQSTHGSALNGFLHHVRLYHLDLGQFDLEVAFSTSDISRNLLGRDFFNQVQIGFRERHMTFFVTPRP